MKRTRALTDGLRRVLGGKRYLLLVYLFNLGITAAMALVLASTIEESLGSSAASERMLEGFDPSWYDGFSREADGLARTFEPSITGIGAVFQGIDEWITGGFREADFAVVGVALLYLLMWTFVSPGLIAKYRRPRDEDSFFHVCARYFPRFLVLGLLSGALYWAVFRFAMPWLESWVRTETRDVIDERIAFAYAVAKYGAIACMLCAVNFLFTYAKIVTVVRRRILVVFTPFEALGFLVCHPLRTLGLYLAVGILWIGLVLLYWLYGYLAPDASTSTIEAILVAWGVGQLFVLGRIFLKMLFLASQTALYENVKAGVLGIESNDPDRDGAQPGVPPFDDTYGISDGAASPPPTEVGS
jgi:hypothetical protein